MVNYRDRALARKLEDTLVHFDQNKRPLIGVRLPNSRAVLVQQMVESVHRVRYVRAIQSREISLKRADPSDELFDPLKAAIICQRAGHIDEAFWLVFLFVHFGRHTKGGWRYAREVYGRLGESSRWDWENASNNPDEFRKWLTTNLERLQRKSAPGGFGNHRKYESLNGFSSNGTGAAVASYVKWVAPPRTHNDTIEEAYRSAAGDPKKCFDYLYRSMAVVTRFGRTARFDYLTMLGKLGLANIEPGSAYLDSATGPLKGAKLLFFGATNAKAGAKDLDRWLGDLDADLCVGMQILEDALCNWQKSPAAFRRFRG